jgi:hypothetical protein
MQQKQDESLNEIQVKLNEINQVKVDLKVTNELKQIQLYSDKTRLLHYLVQLN